MDYLFSADGSLFALFLASFLSATLLPGGSEVVLFAVVRQHPDQTVAALGLATLGNTLGGMSTYLLARLLPQRELPARLSALKRYGTAVLFFSWTPVIGDALCAAAGWLRLNWVASMAWMALGKFGRYVAVAAGAGLL
ncbi:MAG: DedA family protein [Betaproteobacteria bacterium]|nr:DedA family protein [Betaproteobacteria bacterium]